MREMRHMRLGAPPGAGRRGSRGAGLLGVQAVGRMVGSLLWTGMGRGAGTQGCWQAVFSKPADRDGMRSNGSADRDGMRSDGMRLRRMVLTVNTFRSRTLSFLVLSRTLSFLVPSLLFS